MFIDSFDALQDFCSRASRARVLAVDTEFMRERVYYPKLCLIQLATKDEIAVVDPLAIEDLSPIAELFTMQSLTKVFHACSQDLEVIYENLGCEVEPVFDTQIAAAFLGLKQQSSLSNVVEAFCSVHLAKTESLTDWSLRPLESEQLHYAAEDVHYLCEIFEKMTDELVATNRLMWVLPEIDAYVQSINIKRDPDEAYLRLKRSSTLTRRQLALAREIAGWRERVAAKRNIPRKWVLSDEIVVEICRKAPRDVASLHRLRGTEQLSSRDSESIIAAVKRGCNVPAQLCPEIEHKSRPSAEVEGAIDLMYALVRVVSDKTGIATQLIASRDDLLDFLTHKKRSSLASGWRFEIIGAELERLLAGEIGLTVKKGKIEIL